MSIFEKPKFKNKDKVKELKEKFSDKQIEIIDMPKDVLAELFWKAVERIDENENGGEYDERDWKDCLCDKEFIIDELFDALQETIDSGIYK